MLPRLAHVHRRRRDAPGIWTLEIDCTDVPQPFAAGQFNMLGIVGKGEVPISFSGDPARADRLVHTVRAVGPVSSALTALKSGDMLGIRGPFGVGWPIEELAGHDVLIIAGGVGLAPLRPALYHLLAQRKLYRNITLLYGTRSPDDILFRRELETWRSRLDIDIEVTTDHAVGDWHGHVGVVTTLIPHAAYDADNTIALVCGPEIMMRFAIAALIKDGIGADRIYLSMERNMQCAIGHCGHCQFGPLLICRDGPVFRYDRVRDLLGVKEL